MTKKFTLKASDATMRMAELQARKARLQRKLKELSSEEVALKAYLMPYYDAGETEVEVGGKVLRVNFATQERQYLDQQKVIALIKRMGKEVPTFTTEVVTFKVKA